MEGLLYSSAAFSFLLIILRLKKLIGVKFYRNFMLSLKSFRTVSTSFVTTSHKVCWKWQNLMQMRCQPNLCCWHQQWDLRRMPGWNYYNPFLSAGRSYIERWIVLTNIYISLTKPLIPGAETRHRDLLQSDQGAPHHHEEEAVRPEPEPPARHRGQARQRGVDCREDAHRPGGQGIRAQDGEEREIRIPGKKYVLIFTSNR